MKNSALVIATVFITLLVVNSIYADTTEQLAQTTMANQNQAYTPISTQATLPGNNAVTPLNQNISVPIPPNPSVANSAPQPAAAQTIVYVYQNTPQVAPAPQPIKKTPEYESSVGRNPILCFARGITNIATCWLEIPRCVVYDTEVIPVIGTIFGFPEGAIFTVLRAGAGTIDIICLGFDGQVLYGKNFPDFVWESNWMPPENKGNN